MATTENVLETLAAIEEHLRVLRRATRADELIRAVGAYLASWPKNRIRELQKIDGGWGHFDSRANPQPIYGIADIARISGVLSNHCRALKEAGIDPTAELLELDLYFVLAKQVAEEVVPTRPRSVAALSQRDGHRQWSEKGALAA